VYSQTGSFRKYEVERVAKLDQHKAEVWRVSWNLTGTMLASTGDDGTARLWKSDFRGVWHSTMVAQKLQEEDGKEADMQPRE